MIWHLPRHGQPIAQPLRDLVFKSVGEAHRNCKCNFRKRRDNTGLNIQRGLSDVLRKVWMKFPDGDVWL